jgi:hypothetical protein
LAVVMPAKLGWGEGQFDNQRLCLARSRARFAASASTMS